MRRRTHELLEVARPGDVWSRVVDVFLMTLILANAIALALETVTSLQAAASTFFWQFEVFSVAVFTVEYLLRLWSCTALADYRKPVSGRIRFALRPLLLIDLLAVLPAYIPAGVLDLRFLRIVRLMRVFRVAKLARYSSSLQTIGRVFANKKEELLVTLAALGLLLLMAASLVYFAENPAQPDVFTSIPATMWWAVVTLTTVGYGDMAPVTSLGRGIAAGVAVLGVCVIAIPTAIVGAGFVEEMRRQETHEPTHCPHCGKKIL